MPKIFIMMLVSLLLVGPKKELPDSRRARTVRDSV